MKNRPAIYALICALSLTQPASADEYGDMFGLMFRMMLSMMDAMSDVANDNSSDFDWGGGSSLGLGMTTLPMASGMTGLNPWSGFGGMPYNNPGMTPWSSSMMGNPMMGNPWSMPLSGGYSPSMLPGYMNNYSGYPGSQYPGGYGGTAPPAQYAAHSLLSGRWYGGSGEILEVRGNQFRLHDGQIGISGIVSIENNIVNLYAQQTGGVMQYTFARNQSELILQDASGQVLVFSQRPDNRGIRVF
jgi:hypothetical protein